MKEMTVSVSIGLKENVTPIFRVPVNSFCKSCMRSAQVSASWIVRKAKGNISSPASVRRMVWLLRRKSCTPSSSSNCLICCDSELCAMFCALAASEKFSVSPALAKYLSCLNSIVMQNYR